MPNVTKIVRSRMKSGHASTMGGDEESLQYELTQGVDGKIVLKCILGKQGVR
jgi:hypothetical protein